MTKKIENPPLMDEDAQRLYVNSMLSMPDLFARLNGILKPEFFDPGYAKTVEFMQDYFQEHRSVPAIAVVKAATKFDGDSVQLGRGDIDYLLKEIAKFCRFKAVIKEVQKSIGNGGYLENGDIGTMVAKLKEATEIDVVTDLGIDYFDSPMTRLEDDETEDAVISTGWKSVDELIGGGIGRQELVTFLAPSGGGKSVSMLNLGFNLMAQGLHGVYISLEMRDKKVARRTDQMIARFASNLIQTNRTVVAAEIEKFHEKTGARFFIKRMREGTTNANHILAYLRELEARHAFKPDWIIVDYLDLMEPVRRGAGESMFLKDKYVSEEVRAIGFDYDCIMISASQLGKHATDAINEGRQMHQGDVQGGSSKTNTSDLMIATVKTEAMHEAGEYRFEFVKSRNSDANGKKIMMNWSKVSLRISDLQEKELEFKKKTMLMPIPTVSKPKSISDLMEKLSVPE